MKQILLVDDDAVIVQIYRRKFVEAGFDVQVAGDGLAAMKMLCSGLKPEVVILDLMMPKMSGVDVLKFIRSRPDLKDTAVIIFSNSYMSDMVQAAAVAGADKALLKSRCPPALLVEAVDQMLSGAEVPESDTILLAAADYAPTMAAATGTTSSSPPESLEPAGEPNPTTTPQHPQPPREVSPAPDTQAKARAEFLGHAAATLKTIHALVDSVLAATDSTSRQLRLLDLYRKIHFVTSMAGMSGCNQIAQFVSAFEAMLFELQERPGHINVSTTKTINQSVDFLAELFERANHGPPNRELPPASVLVVDDDVISNRLIVTALKRANLKASSEGNPVSALNLIKSNHYDLVLLDISMPELDGFQLCAELRKLPAYARTPVIFVTCHSDFETRSRSILSGGNDLIAKPVLPIELAVKAVTHLLRTQMAAAQPG
jgi:CheY-like chemotaxis protein